MSTEMVGHARLATRAGWVVLGGVTLALLMAEPGQPEAPAGIVIREGIPFKVVDGSTPRLDVLRPADRPAEERLPAIIAVHGGGWRGGSRRDIGTMLAPIVRRGLAVIAIDYRLARPGAPGWPGNVDDTRDAIRWVHEHADSLRIDPRRLALFGVSAGAHLALLAAFQPDKESVTVPSAGRNVDTRGLVGAVVDWYGPTDLSRLRIESPAMVEPISSLLGTGDGFEDRLRRASPLHLVGPGAPPVLVAHGTDDRLVPPSQSRLLIEALDRAGVKCRLIVVAGSQHGFGPQAGSVNLTDELLAFLEVAWKDWAGR